jgi:hypothetical protein
LWRKQFNTRRRQFNRQRQAVETGANFGDGQSIGVVQLKVGPDGACALDWNYRSPSGVFLADL